MSPQVSQKWGVQKNFSRADDNSTFKIVVPPLVTTVVCCAACVADFEKNAKLLCTKCIPEVRNAPELIVSHGCTLDPAPSRSSSQLWEGISLHYSHSFEVFGAFDLCIGD